MMTGRRVMWLAALLSAVFASLALAATPGNTASFVSYIGGNGAGAGQVSGVEDVTTDAAGNLYVDDTGNYRIDKFSPTGAFIMAWGWGVKDGAMHLETCTSVCRIGIPGGGTGQLNAQDAAGLDIAADAAGNVYVTEDLRVDKFTSTGAFIETWGWGVKDGASRFETCTSSCLGGLSSSGSGGFFQPTGLTVDRSGDVYVEDSGNDRIEKFSSAGTFIEAWGWGVKDGAARPETCVTSCGAGLSGAGAGQVSNSSFSDAIGLAAAPSGNLYVADGGNNRIDEFTSSGRFIEAWGWGVRSGAMRLQSCTSVCGIGIGGAGAGQLGRAQRVAIDASGDVLVADYLERRVDEFTSSGAFIDTWGWGVRDGGNAFETCTTGCLGGADVALPQPFGITVDPSDNVYVSNAVASPAGPWIAKFAISAPPVLAQTAVVAPAGGSVSVRSPGSSVFVPVSRAQSIPLHSTVDTTNGTVRLTTATAHRGRTQTARFYAGQFLLTQARSGMTQLKLNAPLDCTAATRDAVTARRRPKRKRPRTRRLWGNGHGTFTTVGLYASGAVQGTEWLTEDTCTGTRLTVVRDSVEVTDFTRHRTILVRAGHSYLAGH
jgi:hypothetical protein